MSQKPAVSLCKKYPKVAARRLQMVALVASGLDYAEVCRRLKISSRTLSTYLSHPGTKDALAEAQKERLDALLRAGLDGAKEALNSLRELAVGAVKESDRIAAANGFLTHVLRLVSPDQTNIHMTQTVDIDKARRIKFMQIMAKDPVLLAARATVAEAQARMIAEEAGTLKPANPPAEGDAANGLGGG